MALLVFKTSGPLTRVVGSIPIRLRQLVPDAAQQMMRRVRRTVRYEALSIFRRLSRTDSIRSR